MSAVHRPAVGTEVEEVRHVRLRLTWHLIFLRTQRENINHVKLPNGNNLFRRTLKVFFSDTVDRFPLKTSIFFLLCILITRGEFLIFGLFHCPVP